MTVTKKRVIRKDAPATPSELPDLTGAFTWFRGIATNERFHIVVDLLKRMKRHTPSDLHPLPHQQHFASGYDAGFNDCIEKLYAIAANPPEKEGEVEAFLELTKREEIYQHES